MKKPIIKKISTILIVTILIILVGGCDEHIVSTSTEGQVENTGMPTKNDYQYNQKITMFAQAYSPVEATKTNPTPPEMLKIMAKKYSELYPGIEVSFVPSLDGMDVNAWIKARIAAGTAPDVFWARTVDLNSGVIPFGSVIDFNGYLEKPNPYVPGNKKWSDIFYPYIQDQLAGPKGEHYSINGDFVATYVVYNKNLFKKAGIKTLPKTWSEFTEINKELLSAGITPWAFAFGSDIDSQDRMTWLSRLFHTNFYYDYFQSLGLQEKEISLSTKEILTAFKNGIFGPDDPRWIGWWPVIKDQIPYMHKDSLSAGITPSGIFNMFVNEQIAMYFDGSWAHSILQDAEVSFEYGTFSFPYPDPATSKLASNYNSASAEGGPYGAFQFCISTPKANSSMNEEKLPICVDWLMFISKPENAEAIVNEVGACIPSIKNANPLPHNIQISELMNSKPVMIEGGLLTLGTTVLDAYYSTFCSYLSDKITLDQAVEKLRPIVKMEVDKKIQN
jgi:ABC-type glycerol-3-phosphate transport system substrate-binding protein